MDLNNNYYQILGVDKNASVDEIKKKYKKLALELHPDKNNGDKIKEEKFKKISEAYSIIGDPTKKQQYDVSSPHGNSYNPNPFAQMGGGVEDIFNSFFGGGNPFGNPFGRKTEYREFHENLDINVNVIITLSDIYKAQPFKVEYKRYQHCDDCNGTGFDRTKDSNDCEICDGTGRDNYGNMCEYCQGIGKIYSGECKKCKGEKITIKDHNFIINNIIKVRQSSEEYLRGFGHQSKYFRNKQGTLKLNIIYQNIKNHTIENEQLFFKLDLHFNDAINGMKYEYETLDNSKLLVNIPPKTNDGDIIRLKNKGLMDDNGVRGDLLFRINIVIDYEKLQKIKYETYKNI